MGGGGGGGAGGGGRGRGRGSFPSADLLQAFQASSENRRETFTTDQLLSSTLYSELQYCTYILGFVYESTVQCFTCNFSSKFSICLLLTVVLRFVTKHATSGQRSRIKYGYFVAGRGGHKEMSSTVFGLDNSFEYER